MWYWNWLDCDERVTHDIQRYYNTSQDLQWIVKKAIAGAYHTFVRMDLQGFVDNCPLLTRWMKRNNVYPAYMIFFVSSPHDDPDYKHTDIDEAGVSINFPIANCLGTSCIFYHKPDDLKINLVDLGNGHVYNDCLTEKKWHEHSRYELVKPIIMNNQVPHRFTNPKDSVRISFSIRLDPTKELPTHLIKEN